MRPSDLLANRIAVVAETGRDEGLEAPLRSGVAFADYDGLVAGDAHSRFTALAISVNEVRANFRKYDLLDDRVRFLKGWFKDTLMRSRFSGWPLLRLDGDMYQSTMEGFEADDGQALSRRLRDHR